jgi:hypothetical protein
MAAKPRRGKMEGFQRINMIGFTERLERFGRAKTVQARNWCTEEERLSMGVGGGSVVVVVVEELGLKVGSRWLG